MSDDVQFNLRLPKHIKDGIAEAAKKNGRSINGEAAFRLLKTLEQDDFMSSANGCAEVIGAIEEAEANTDALQTALDNVGAKDSVSSSVLTSRLLKRMEALEKQVSQLNKKAP